MKTFLKILAIGVLLTAFSGVVLAVGEDGDPPGGEGGGFSFTIPNPLSCDSVQDCFANIIQGLIILAATILVVMVVVGAYQFMTSAGNPEKVSNAKKTIIYAVIGFAVILLAQSFVFIIRNLIGTEGGGACTGTQPDGPCPGGGFIQCIDGVWQCPTTSIVSPSWLAQNSYDRIILTERSSYY